MHCTEKSLARNAAAVMISVVVGATPVRQGRIGQWLRFVEIEVTAVAARGS